MRGSQPDMYNGALLLTSVTPLKRLHAFSHKSSADATTRVPPLFYAFITFTQDNNH